MINFKQKCKNLDKIKKNISALIIKFAVCLVNLFIDFVINRYSYLN